MRISFVRLAMLVSIGSLAALATAACGSSPSDDSATPDSGAPDSSGGTDAGSGDTGPNGDASPSLDSGSPGEGDLDAGPAVSVSLKGCPGSTCWTDVTLGGTQTLAAVVTLSSGTSAFADATCTASVTPRYTPGASATDQNTTTSESYSDGSSWNAEVFADTFQLGAAPAVAMKFGSIKTRNQYFLASTCDASQGSFQGILALGTNALSTATEPYVNKLSSPDILAFRLCANGGTMWLGPADLRVHLRQGRRRNVLGRDAGGELVPRAERRSVLHESVRRRHRGRRLARLPADEHRNRRPRGKPLRSRPQTTCD